MLLHGMRMWGTSSTDGYSASGGAHGAPTSLGESQGSPKEPDKVSMELLVLPAAHRMIPPLCLIQKNPCADILTVQTCVRKDAGVEITVESWVRIRVLA